MDDGGILQPTYSRGKALRIVRAAELAWLEPSSVITDISLCFCFVFKKIKIKILYPYVFSFHIY